MSHRIGWIDNAKAIAIVLVVWGHTSGIDLTSKTLIYSFHVPLFFFLSGCLVREQHLSLRFGEYLGRCLRRLIVPYVSFWVLSYGYWLLRCPLLADSAPTGRAEFLEPLCGLIYGTGETLGVNIVLWFFPCLFCTSLLHWCLWRVKSGTVSAFLMAASGCVAYWLHRRVGVQLPWGSDIALVAIPFVGLGYVVQRSGPNWTQLPALQRLLALAALATYLIMYLPQDTLVDVCHLQLGDLTSFYINALLGIGAVLLVASLLPTNRVARWLGENTIVIFPLHLLAFGVITSVAMFGFHVDKDFKDDSVTWSLFYTIAAIGLCLVCAPVFRWCLPWAIGLPGRPVSGEALTRASTPCDATRHTGLGERLPVRNAPARH